MNPDQVAKMIQAGLPGSTATVTSPDNVHFEAVVVAPAFSGKRALQRHQLVYATLGARMGNEETVPGVEGDVPQPDDRCGCGAHSAVGGPSGGSLERVGPEIEDHVPHVTELTLGEQ